MDDALINKTMDRNDLARPACRRILTELFGLMRRMQRVVPVTNASSIDNAPRSMRTADVQPADHSVVGTPTVAANARNSHTLASGSMGGPSSGVVAERATPATSVASSFTNRQPLRPVNGNESFATNSQALTYSSWYGRLAGWPGAWEHINRGMAYQPYPGNPDELKVPWFLLWEIAWLVANTPLRPGSRVLDMGGAGSLFSCFLAARGHDVVSIDIDADLCRRADALGTAMNWRMRGEVMDMAELDFPDGHFDHIFSVCVFEHLPVSGRVRCNEHIRRVLKPGGTASYTFDYANPQAFGRLATPEDVNWQFVEPSGLSWRGQPRFEDNGLRYLSCPQSFGFGRFTESAARIHAFVTGSMERAQVLANETDYTFGALFLKKADG